MTQAAQRISVEDLRFTVGDTVVPPARRTSIELPVAQLATGTWLSLPLEVICGARPVPRLWLTATILQLDIHRQALGQVPATSLLPTPSPTSFRPQIQIDQAHPLIRRHLRIVTLACGYAHFAVAPSWKV